MLRKTSQWSLFSNVWWRVLERQSWCMNRCCLLPTAEKYQIHVKVYCTNYTPLVLGLHLLGRSHWTRLCMVYLGSHLFCLHFVFCVHLFGFTSFCFSFLHLLPFIIIIIFKCLFKIKLCMNLCDFWLMLV